MERGEHDGAAAAEGGSTNELAGTAATAIEQAQLLLERFSLTASESKTLVALMRLGSATPTQLSPLTGIGRTNVYRTLEALQDKGLAHKLPGRSAAWVALERDEIIWRLREREQERARATEAALEQARAALEAVPEAESKAPTVVRVVDEAAGAFRYYEALATAAEEVLVFNRGPYVGELEVENDVVEALARGVTARALWQAHDLSGPDGGEALRCARGYADAGVATRVAQSLDLSLAVVDRRLTLLRLPPDEPGDLAYVASAVVDNRAFAAAMAQVFETAWEAAEDLVGEPAKTDTSAGKGGGRLAGGATAGVIMASDPPVSTDR